MSLRLKFNLIFGLASLLGVLVTGFLAHHLLQQNAREEVLDSARIMLESARAVRGYTVSEIRPLLELQQKRQFLPQTVPAYSARIYINKLQKKYPNYSYKEATLNPTNPVDLAATIYHQLGVPSDLELHDHLGRPFTICPGNVISELV